MQQQGILRKRMITGRMCIVSLILIVIVLRMYSVKCYSMRDCLTGCNNICPRNKNESIEACKLKRGILCKHICKLLMPYKIPSVTKTCSSKCDTEYSLCTQYASRIKQSTRCNRERRKCFGKCKRRKRVKMIVL